jgi:hypothetical protein
MVDNNISFGFWGTPHKFIIAKFSICTAGSPFVGANNMLD